MTSISISNATGIQQTTPASPTKPRSIVIPAPFTDLTPPSSPSEEEKSSPLDDTSSKAPVADLSTDLLAKAAQFGTPAVFKHYASRGSSFKVNGNGSFNGVEDSVPASPPLSPPSLPIMSTVEVPEEEEKPAPAPIVSTVTAFRHVSQSAGLSANININGSRRRSSAKQVNPAPKAAPSIVDDPKPTELDHDLYLPPSPALTPSHSSSAVESLEDVNTPPSKFSHRCRLCGKWIETRLGPGNGKATRGVRLHMVQWHASQLSIGVYRDEVGRRDVGVGWIC